MNDIDFQIKIPEFIECVGSNERNNPTGVINPIFELYFEPQGAMLCDYDRILLAPDGVWHWEHEDYYPEYAQACIWELNYPENLDYYSNRPPDTFPGYIEPEHPIWGKVVNSLSWYSYFDSIDSFIQEGNGLLPINLDKGFIAVNGIKLTNFELNTFVNPVQGLYAPKMSHEGKIKVRAPSQYVHWLTIGTNENEPLVFVFYPQKPKKRIRVILLHDNVEHSVMWTHGHSGLTREIDDYIRKYFLVPLEKRSSDFFESAFNVAKSVQNQYDDLRNKHTKL